MITVSYSYELSYLFIADSFADFFLLSFEQEKNFATFISLRNQTVLSLYFLVHILASILGDYGSLTALFC